MTGITHNTVNSRYSGHPWDYPKWLEYRDGRISGYLEIPAAIFETVSRASSPACKVHCACDWFEVAGSLMA